jgi:Uma2 family endonuclease
MAYAPSVSDQTMPYMLTLNVKSLGLTDEQFLRLCADNEDLRLELTAAGELLIMPPTGLEAGWRNSNLSYRLVHWAEQDGSGLAFDSSTLFTLPNGAKRSPDAAWVRRDRWEALNSEQREGTGPLCPDFVVELRSPSDRLSVLQDKMVEYLDNGAQLGWLIDALDKRVYIYRPGQPVEALENPATLSGGPVLPGFVFEVREIL